MADDRDLRNVILILVRAHKLWKARANVATAVLNHLESLPPTDRALWTPADAEKLALQIHWQVESDLETEAFQVEEKIEGEEAFVEALRIYGSRQFWNTWPQASKGTHRVPPASST